MSIFRKPFAYESNALLIRDLLVPDPLSESEWKEAVREWKELGEGPLSLLAHLMVAGYLKERNCLRAMEKALGLKSSGWCHEPTNPLEDGPKQQMLRKLGFLPLKPLGGKKLLAGGPTMKPDLSLYLGAEAEEWEWILYSPLYSGDSPMTGSSPDQVQEESPSVADNWIRQLFDAAWAKECSDIHLETAGATTAVRIRTTQGMEVLGSWERDRVARSIRLIKHRAGISTADNALPQDGRLEIDKDGSKRSFRLSLIKTVSGESLVLRNLERPVEKFTLEGLGIPPPLAKMLHASVRWESGLVLCTGPTGAGKTTTLYGLLSELDGQPLKVVTIEDPIEYHLPSATQCAVAPENGWTFDQAVRSFLRQDPDIILLGEIRDRESAEIACRAALTGHAVLATLHAKSPQSALLRLRNWGIPSGIMAEIIRLVVNQRLHFVQAESRMRATFSWIKPDPAEIGEFFTNPHAGFSWQTACLTPNLN